MKIVKWIGALVGGFVLLSIVLGLLFGQDPNAPVGVNDEPTPNATATASPSAAATAAPTTPEAAAPDRNDKTASPRSDADVGLARRVRQGLRENFTPGAPSWYRLIRTVRADAGHVEIVTEIGDDSDAEGPVTAICGAVGPGLGDIDGVESMEVYGVDRSGNQSSIGDCNG